jgi:hypothetical protein
MIRFGVRPFNGHWWISAHPMVWVLLGWLALPFIVAGWLLVGAAWLVWQAGLVLLLAAAAVSALVRAYRDRREEAAR